MAPPNPIDPPPAVGEGEEGRANFRDRAAESYLESMDPAAREAILADRDTLQVNPGRIPARHYARADDKSFEGLFRAILADHKGLAKDITESDFRRALQALREAPARGDPGEVHVAAPTHFGQQDLKKEDLDAWRRFNSDSKGGLDLRSIFEYVCSYHVERGNIFSEDSLRRHLYILVPKKHMTSLAWKVKRMYSLQKIFDECLISSVDVKTEEELRNDIEKTLENPRDVISALRKTMELLEQCPNGGDTLDNDCLREAKRLIKRLGGPELSNQVLALFQKEPVLDFASYFSIIKKYFTEILNELSQKPQKVRAHNIGEVEPCATPHEREASSSHGSQIQTGATPTAQPEPGASSSAEKTETAILLEILARLNGQPNAQQVSNVYPVAQQYSVGVVSQGNRSLHRGRRGHYDHRPSQHPMVLTSPAPMALAGPPAYGPPPATEQQGQRGDQHSRIGQVNAVAAKLAELTAILKSMD